MNNSTQPMIKMIHLVGMLTVLLGVACLGNTIGDGTDSFFTAASKGDLAGVKAFIANGANLNAKDKVGRTPLMLAAWKGQTEILQLLLVNGANPNAENKSGTTALMYASRFGNLEAAHALLDKGAQRCPVVSGARSRCERAG